MTAGNLTEWSETMSEMESPESFTIVNEKVCEQILKNDHEIVNWYLCNFFIYISNLSRRLYSMFKLCHLWLSYQTKGKEMFTNHIGRGWGGFHVSICAELMDQALVEYGQRMVFAVGGLEALLFLYCLSCSAAAILSTTSMSNELIL